MLVSLSLLLFHYFTLSCHYLRRTTHEIQGVIEEQLVNKSEHANGQVILKIIQED